MLHSSDFANDFWVFFCPQSAKPSIFWICRTLQSLLSSQTQSKQVKLLRRRVNPRPGNCMFITHSALFLLYAVFCFLLEKTLGVFSCFLVGLHFYAETNTAVPRLLLQWCKYPLIWKTENADTGNLRVWGQGTWAILSTTQQLDFLYRRHRMNFCCYQALRMDDTTDSFKAVKYPKYLRAKSGERLPLSCSGPGTSPKNASLLRNCIRDYGCLSLTLSRW